MSPRARTPTAKKAAEDVPVLSFSRQRDWDNWLAAHHASSSGVWIKLAKKASGIPSVTHPEAVAVALAWGWIDGLAKRLDESWWVQKFGPRRPKSGWSKINREKARALIAAGKMKPAGLAEVERAQRDGRWDAAYDSPARAQVPRDLAEVLAATPRAAAFFKTLDSRNRYAVLFRIHNAKKPETRAKRIAQFVAMLAKGEKLYP